MSASINAIASYFKIPIVWFTGIIAALGIMTVYLLTTYLNLFVGICVLLIFLNILPFFFAGIYGMILDGNTKKGAFIMYARYGYSRCLSPALFIFMICILVDLLLGPFALIILIPILFFIYFADITAIRHNLRTGQALKDSALRVIRGSILVIIFYLGNFIACVLCGLFIDLVFGFVIQAIVPTENLLNLASLVEPTFETLSQNIFTTNSIFTTDVASQTLLTDIFKELINTPGLMPALAISLAAGALIFTPFFVAYKAYFFRDLLLAEATVAAVVKAAQEQAARQANGENAADVPQNIQSESQELSAEKEKLPNFIPESLKKPENSVVLAYDPHAGEDGEYDAKGRWFKYK